MELCRVNTQVIDSHEKRRGDHPNLPRYDADILRSMGYWRWASRRCAHADEQYRAHRQEAMRRVRLPAHQPARQHAHIHPAFAALLAPWSPL